MFCAQSQIGLLDSRLDASFFPFRPTNRPRIDTFVTANRRLDIA